MTEPDGARRAATLRYRLRVRGNLSSHWSAWFDGMAISLDADGNTTLEGTVADQTALYGLIAKARNLGLTLLLVELIRHEG